MIFEQDSIHTEIPQTEEQKNSSYDLILEKINRMETLSNLDEAYDFLQKNFNIYLNISCIHLSADYTLRIKKSVNNVIFDFMHQDDHIIFCYKK